MLALWVIGFLSRSYMVYIIFFGWRLSQLKKVFFFFLSQNYYVHDLLIGLKMDGARDVQTPMSTIAKLVLSDGYVGCEAT